MIRKLCFFLFCFAASMSASAQASALPYKQFIFVEFEQGHCPDGFCQLVYYRNVDSQDPANEDYQIYASNLNLPKAPDSLTAYHIRFPGSSYTEIYASLWNKNATFYLVREKLEIIDSQSYITKFVQYESDPEDPNQVAYPIN
jgi:hypothetical protein